MTPERAVEILEDLVDGIHPFTREVLPMDNICEERGVVDALNCAIQVMNEWIVARDAIDRYRRRYGEQARPEERAVSERETGRRVKPKNAGQPWTPESDDRLQTLYREGVPVGRLAHDFGRTRSAIKSRLMKLGLLEERPLASGTLDGGRQADDEAFADVGIRIDPGAMQINAMELRNHFLNGESIADLARRYGRTEKAIQARLFYMGFGGSGPKLLPDRDKDR